MLLVLKSVSGTFGTVSNVCADEIEFGNGSNLIFRTIMGTEHKLFLVLRITERKSQMYLINIHEEFMTSLGTLKF